MGKSTQRADKQAEIHPCRGCESQGDLHRCQPRQGQFQAVVSFRFNQESCGQNARVGQIRRKMADTARTGRAVKPSGAAPVPKRSLIKAATRLTVAVTIGFCFAVSGVFASDHTSLVELSESGPEMILVQSLKEVAESRVDSALSGIEEVLKTNPNFRLAHLIKGDLLLARSRPISELGNTSAASQEHVSDLREEARVRVQRHLEQVPSNLVPRYLLQMQPDQKYAIIADTGKSRLYIFRNVGGAPRYVADYYISSGKNGSQKIKEGDK